MMIQAFAGKDTNAPGDISRRQSGRGQARLIKARVHFEEVRAIRQNVYHRRDPEVLLIQAELEINEGNKKQAKETLKTAERRINEMGCYRWDREVEILQSKLDRHRSGDG